MKKQKEINVAKLIIEGIWAGLKKAGEGKNGNES